MQLALKSHNCPEAVHSSTSGTNRQLHLHIYTFNLGKTFKRQISLRTGLNRKKKSLCHVTMVANFLDLNKPCNWSCKYGWEKKKNEKLTCTTSVCACLHSRKKKRLPNDFSSIVRQYKWSSLSGEKAKIEIHKLCYYSNVTSHFPINTQAEKFNWRKVSEKRK